MLMLLSVSINNYKCVNKCVNRHELQLDGLKNYRLEKYCAE